LNGDNAVDDADLRDASAWRRVHCNGGASSTMEAVVFGFVYGSDACRDGRPRRGGGVAAQREEEGLGFEREPRLGD
jgi:hypothetical protein